MIKKLARASLLSILALIASVLVACQSSEGPTGAVSGARNEG